MRASTRESDVIDDVSGGLAIQAVEERRSARFQLAYDPGVQAATRASDGRGKFVSDVG